MPPPARSAESLSITSYQCSLKKKTLSNASGDLTDLWASGEDAIINAQRINELSDSD